MRYTTLTARLTAAVRGRDACAATRQAESITAGRTPAPHWYSVRRRCERAARYLAVRAVR